MTQTPHPLLDTLTDPERYRAADPQDMMGLVLKLPQQCREAVAIGERFGPEPAGRPEIRQVVVTGLGGSAIGGDFARCLMDEYGSVPLLVNRDYTLPRYVGPQTLVIAASYSGNTEETLAAYGAAQAAGAQRAVVTSGGRLGELAQADGIPMARVPGGQPPRSATGYMFFPLLGYLMHRRLLARDLTGDIAETLAHLATLPDRLGPDVPTAQNPAKRLAVALHGKLPILYGSQGYRGAVALRWKGQFNENTKIHAFANIFPEQNHNEILGWALARQQAQTWATIFLRDPEEVSASPRIAHRITVTKELIGKETEVHEVWAEGSALLTRLFHLLYFGDFVSVYLAYLYGVCPTNMQAIEHLKAEMAKLG
ncbi:MAG TPA: bifunctional phosphoglucose/phosphomannose isomerase [Chthonomonadaceae bacterium]|nr:bifunctional phosphoglucose/phosphomannose isomerase [Chthonomonadaceae bacterium]